MVWELWAWSLLAQSKSQVERKQTSRRSPGKSSECGSKALTSQDRGGFSRSISGSELCGQSWFCGGVGVMELWLPGLQLGALLHALGMLLLIPATGLESRGRCIQAWQGIWVPVLLKGPHGPRRQTMSCPPMIKGVFSMFPYFSSRVLYSSERGANSTNNWCWSSNSEWALQLSDVVWENKERNPRVIEYSIPSRLQILLLKFSISLFAFD